MCGIWCFTPASPTPTFVTPSTPGGSTGCMCMCKCVWERRDGAVAAQVWWSEVNFGAVAHRAARDGLCGGVPAPGVNVHGPRDLSVVPACTYKARGVSLEGPMVCHAVQCVSKLTEEHET